MVPARRDSADARVHLSAALRDLPLRLQRAAFARVADPRTDDEVVRAGDRQPGRAGRAAPVREGGARRDRDRAPARLPGGARRRAVPLLRARGDLVPRHPADRAARDRDRDGSQRDLPQPSGAVRRRPRPVHDHGRACDLLHRRRLQQRGRATAADGGLARGGVRRSRGRRLADVPLRHLSAAEDGPAGRRTPRLCAQLRRGDRDHVHRGRRSDAADLDPEQPVAAEPAPDRERRRRLRDRSLDDPGLLRVEAVERVRRAAASPAARARTDVHRCQSRL